MRAAAGFDDAKLSAVSVVDDILGEAGPIARALGEGFEPRPEQLRMAERVAQTMAQRGRLMVEAGTGVGKSFAYLAPAIERACRHGETVVIATNTIALQEQLMAKDIPMMASAMEGFAWTGSGGDVGGESDGMTRPLKAVLVKGRGNYVSIRRLKLASQRQASLIPDAAGRRSLHVIEDWAYQTTDGSLATLPPLERRGVWDKVQSDSGNCMGRRCPHHADCFYQKARREMEGANLLICNHAMFFSDLALRARGEGVGILPRYDHVVLDEAHSVEDVAAEHFGLRLSEGRVRHLLTTLVHEKTGKGYLPQLELAIGDFRPIERAIGLVRSAEEASRVFFEDLIRLSRSSEVTNGRIRREGAIVNRLTEVMNALTVVLRGMKDDVRTEADRFELNAMAMRASEIGDTAEALVEQTARGCVYWVEVQDHDGGRPGARVTLACSPIRVAGLLKERLFAKECSVTMTSATLATRSIGEDEPAERAETAFAFTIDRLGCEGTEVLQLGSPFEYARQVEVLVDATMPSPGGGGGRYEDELAKRIHEHVVATEGGAFVLFTSFRTLNAVADRLESVFASLGYPLLAQGRGVGGGGLPRSELLERFRTREGAVLFGAASFWQGVDVRGDQLRNVIITRLPFEPPDRPLTEARCELIEAEGGSAFKNDSLPRAVIRFKQGFGRLIRSKSDRGRVVVLDSRIVSKGYGRLFLQALPEGVRVERVGGVEHSEWD
ncbi:MAG: ATP-dependent DNA helicase DinG [Phycisphaerales bacterium]|jgi:ATP-dependent DNA helicase DinG